MRVLTWNLALGTWLMVSCFVFSQTAPSIILGYSVAVIVLAASIAAQAKPFARYAITAIALWSRSSRSCCGTVVGGRVTTW